MKKTRGFLSNNSAINRLFELYSLFFGYPWIGHHVRWRLLKKEMNSLGPVVVDIGCGSGFFSDRLARRMGDVIAIDLDKKTIQYANKKYGNRVNFVVADAQWLPLRPMIAGSCICIEVIEHIREDILVTEEASRVLRPNGQLFLTTPRHSFHPLHLLLGDFTHVRKGYATEELVQLLKGRFDMVKVREYLRSWGRITFTIQYLLYRRGVRERHSISLVMLLIVFPILKYLSLLDHFSTSRGLELECLARKIST